MAQHEKDDRRLDEYLRGDSTLTRAYREIGREAPPPALDAAILAQAKAAVAGAPARNTRPRWFVPVSLAATVVLSVGVALFMARQDAGPLPSDVTPIPEKSPETKAPAVPDRIKAPSSVVPKTPAPTDAPRFEPRVFTPKEMPAPKAPEQWLAEIEALRRAGKHTEAEAELAKLRQRYPDFPVGERPK